MTQTGPGNPATAGMAGPFAGGAGARPFVSHGKDSRMDLRGALPDRPIPPGVAAHPVPHQVPKDELRWPSACA